MKRRKFIQNSLLATAAPFVPKFIQNSASSSLFSKDTSGRKLIIIQLSGGNDGLNTIIPFTNSKYYSLRPKIGIPKNKIIKVSKNLGWNPGLKTLLKDFEKGNISILNNVGYPNPNRSHFRSMDIWQTGSAANEYLQTGWIGRYLDSQCEADCSAHNALEFDDSLSLALKGKNQNGFAMSKPQLLKKLSKNNIPSSTSSDNETLNFLYKTMSDTKASANILYEHSKKKKSQASYPKTGLGKDLNLVANLILSDNDTKIYYLSHSGFDTHAYQVNKQERLLKEYSEAVSCFLTDMRENDLLDETLILTFSEFGRRAKENGSAGTDHGAANNTFLMGGNLKNPGYFNEGPDLENLLNGDLKHEIDFRSIYNEIVSSWWGLSKQQFFDNKVKNLSLFS